MKDFWRKKKVFSSIFTLCPDLDIGDKKDRRGVERSKTFIFALTIEKLKQTAFVQSCFKCIEAFLTFFFLPSSMGRVSLNH
jgi:hypothetical protein